MATAQLPLTNKRLTVATEHVAVSTARLLWDLDNGYGNFAKFCRRSEAQSRFCSQDHVR